MRWLLLKDLQILWRSKLLLGLLIVYPIAIATLMGFALSSGPEKPRVAFLNQIPANRDTIRLGDKKIDASTYTDQLFTAIDRVDVQSREQAIQKVKSGAVLAALIVPPDFTTKLSNSGLSGAEIEVIYNGDALKQSFVRSTISSKLAEADAALAKQINGLAAGYIDVILKGGKIEIIGASFDILGLQESKRRLDEVMRSHPSPRIRRLVAPVQNFAEIGVANADRFKDVLDPVEKPVVVKQTTLSGRRTPL
ncbi:MAG: type transport system permease protein, partial [bacterium]